MRRVRFVIAALLTVLGIAPLGAQEPTGTIRGRVVDEGSQQPLARVTVAVGARGVKVSVISGVGVMVYGTRTMILSPTYRRSFNLRLFSVNKVFTVTP